MNFSRVSLSLCNGNPRIIRIQFSLSIRYFCSGFLGCNPRIHVPRRRRRSDDQKEANSNRLHSLMNACAEKPPYDITVTAKSEKS
jgi:hypothetical protein